MGAGEEVLQDELRRERRDGEVEPLQPPGRGAEDQPDQRRHDAGERDAERHRDVPALMQPGAGEGAEAEEGGMADADLAGEADQNVQPQRGDTERADIDQDADS